MAKKLGFRWDSTAQEISFFYFEDSNLEISPFHCYEVTNQAQAREVLRLFEEMLLNTDPGTIEYRIVSRNPTHDTPNNPTLLTRYILNEFDLICENHPEWQKAADQVRGELKKQSLKKFKAGLKSFSLANKAYQWHLWAIATHATSGTVKKKLEMIYKTIKLTSLRTRAERQQFLNWYQQLG